MWKCCGQRVSQRPQRTHLPPHVGWINLLVASLLTYGLGRLHGKREALQEKRLLME